MNEHAGALRGRRILIIEDSPVVGPFTADMLTDLGCTVVGPAPNMAAARELVEEGKFDAALMDVHIRGERVFPLCDQLDAKGIPFVLTSGYADWNMPEKWRPPTPSEALHDRPGRTGARRLLRLTDHIMLLV